ncbi:stalk domain-containing protein [Mangrovibacillus cuniculi]|uniref:GH26 domain-containing protein n=1 Tax=Mangrovibacillus cuniculi TaxID=2593652 RepID=A0A7S8CCP3_9BACI|nr:stalk domain-containing protein [Mangrovibacillus cuniculi]QPC47538.1 hypothetical protein G8O30_11545 [Mangrovibacillus cuniculi]
MKQKFTIIILAMSLIFSAFLPNVTEASSDWKYVKRGLELMDAGRYSEAIVQFETAISISPKASSYRNLAISHEKIEQFQKAADAYYAEAAIHQKLGDTNTYLATKAKADALNTDVDVYFDQQLIPNTTGLQKYEPAAGTYIGAYVEVDELKGQTGTKYSYFNQVTNKKHAMYFRYYDHGDPFPTSFVNQVKEAGGAVQIAYQPTGSISTVKDDATLRSFAKSANAAGIPIFLRFASEMNGDWVKWGGNPSEYKRVFQLVSKVMKAEAPNVAMVWAPNSVPAGKIHDYYPGDSAVDWVGMNLYSVPVFNGNASQPAGHVNPLDFLDEVYNRYSSRKPMMIAEFGASHKNSAIGDATQFGKTKMAQFYEGIRLRYPRVKSINWFSVDTLTAPYVAEDRRLNNFSLSVNQTMLSTYKNIISHPHYRSVVENGVHAAKTSTKSTVALPLKDSLIRESITGYTYAKTYDPYISKIIYKLNGQTLSQATSFPYKFSIPYSSMKSGNNNLEIVIFDSKGREASRKTATFQKGSVIQSLPEKQIVLRLGETRAYTSKGVVQLTEEPFLTNSRTFVPLRFISEYIGGTVQYNASTKKIDINSNGQKIVITLGQKTATVNGSSKIMEQAPIVRNGTTLVPLRAVTDLLNGKTVFTTATREITLSF